MTRLAVLACLLLALGVAGCATLGGPVDHYAIYAPAYTAPPREATASPVDWQLAIPMPDSSRALDSTRIFVMSAPGMLETLPGARWNSPLPALLQGLVIDAFRDSGRITGVGASTSILRADYALAIDINRFFIEVRDGSPRASIEIYAALQDLATNRVVAGRTFDAQAPATSTSGADPLIAFEAAIDRLLPEVVDWTFANGAAAHAQPAAKASP